MKLVLECAKAHEGEVSKARKMIEEARDLGAYAVKFQAYDLKDRNTGHPNSKRNLRCHLTLGELEVLSRFARHHGLEFWCSAFSRSVIKPLREFSHQIKIPSTYIFWEDFVHECLDTFPIIHASTGFCSREDITALQMKYVRRVFEREPKKIIWYLCTSAYPCGSTALSRIRLNGLEGFSYHGSDIRAPLLAIERGVKYVELHYQTNGTIIPWGWDYENIRALLVAERHQESLLFDPRVVEREVEENYKFYKKEFKGLNASENCLSGK